MRLGDIVDHLEQHISIQNLYFRPMVAILDLLHGSHHDAARGALTIWLHRTRPGQVIGTFLFPPCETFSIDRHNQLADSIVVPVRSGSQPWGLTALTQRQYNQITIGSFLLLAALAFITLAVLLENSAMVEHPAFLGRKHIDLDAASIRRLPEMLRVLRYFQDYQQNQSMIEPNRLTVPEQH